MRTLKVQVEMLLFQLLLNSKFVIFASITVHNLFEKNIVNDGLCLPEDILQYQRGHDHVCLRSCNHIVKHTDSFVNIRRTTSLMTRDEHHLVWLGEELSLDLGKAWEDPILDHDQEAIDAANWVQRQKQNQVFYQASLDQNLHSTRKKMGMKHAWQAKDNEDEGD